uniref:Uncharacterized protein n=1 Tax=Ananas comosus var. bracteatus TaxID=296719 RepID=A0A6V7PYJ4_ANACO|nr:unnamed protein product [Ananas comosus var. bracteatus]
MIISDVLQSAMPPATAKEVTAYFSKRKNSVGGRQAIRLGVAVATSGGQQSAGSAGGARGPPELVKRGRWWHWRYIILGVDCFCLTIPTALWIDMLNLATVHVRSLH